MDLKNLSVFGLANQKMDYLTQKQQVIAGNIANANTPGYLPKDVSEPNWSVGFKKPALEMAVTNPMHLANRPTQNIGGVVYTPKPSASLTMDGNAVVLEEQLNEASKASSEYNKVISIYTNYKNMLKTASTKISI